MADVLATPAAADASSMLASAPPSFDNASVWRNFTVWTAHHIPFLNMTRLAPAIDDIVWAGPRMVMKLGRLGSFISFPDAIDGIGGFSGLHQRVIPEATDAAGTVLFQGVTAAVPPPPAGSFVAAAAAAAGAAEAVASGAAAGAAAAAATTAAAAAADIPVVDPDFTTTLAASASRFSMEGARGLGSLFSYATSKWAICCIATAVLLNRTYIFAATRRRVRLRWPVRLMLRSLPIVLFFVQARRLLQSIQCQTSPDFAELRWGNASRHSDLMFSEASPFLHGLSSHLLLNPSDAESCRAVRMVPSDRYALVSDLRGSLSLLWPLFVSFCLSHFIETLSCAVQGRPVASETGMTVFEHSLAFAEADAAISNQLGWGSFVSTSTSSLMTSSSAQSVAAATGATAATAATAASTLAAAAAGASSASASASSVASSAAIAYSRSIILGKVNTPPEVLFLAFLSAMSHITSHVLGILNLQSKFRLISTGFWALCFMGSIIWSALTFSLDDPSGQSLLRFPTVSIVGFVPHMLVLSGILACCFIYALALLLAALSLEPDAVNEAGQRLTFRERLAQAHANMQANLPMGSLRINMEMDCYTALVRAGFDAITMASEAVYLNEDRRVNLRLHTWLEEERFSELQDLHARWLGSDLPGSRFEAVGATGLVPAAASDRTSASLPGSTSGYARERVAQKAATGKAGERTRPIRAGIGASERSGRWLMAVEYLAHVGKLVLTFVAVHVCRFLTKIGFTYQPRWLRRFVQHHKAGHADGEERSGSDLDGLEDERGSEWFTATTGSVPIQRRNQVDVEQEIRRRFGAGRDISVSARQEEREIDSKLYQWWLKGGWWGELDNSGTYEPSIAADEDATSVISAFDDNTSEFGWESADDDDNDGEGQRTPTRRSPFASREGTPMNDMPMEMPDLASLLDPRSPEEREQAQALAAHLKSDGILTRSSFAQFRQRQRAEVLATSRSFGGSARRMADFRPGARLSPEEEAQLLEQILISRRTDARDAAELHEEDETSTWATGAAGLGPDGPQCVVCQSAPRTIIVWPCRCLSLCDDCRVSLAMNNFDKCVCCRRGVVSFSRIYVP